MCQTIATELAVRFEQGRDYRRAVQYLQKAAETAIQRSAHHEAIDHLTKGLKLLELLPDTPERRQQALTLHVSLGPPLMLTRGYGATEATEAYTAARELLHDEEDSLQALQVLGGHWLARIVRPQLPALREFVEQWLQMCQNSQNRFYITCGHLALGVTSFYQGELITARDQLKEGLTTYDPQDRDSTRSIFGQDPGVVCLCYSARNLWHLGYPEVALQKGHEAIALAQQVDDRYCLALATIYLTWVYKMRRELPSVEAYAASATDVSRQYEFPLWLTQGLALSGWVLVEQGQHQHGIAQIQEALTTWKLFADIEFPGLATLLAEAFARAGNIDAGLAALAEGQAVMEKTEQRFFEAEIYRLCGELSFQEANQKSKVKSQKSPVPST